MPAQTPEAVIEAQRQDWNRVAPGWDKWDQFFNRTMAFINHRLVADARVRPGLRVLDLGSGTGYPAILAGEVVGAEGMVIGIDLAESMLAVAARKAKTLGLQQVSFRTGDVTSLPFETGSIDAVISRFCLMFLPEIPKAAAEIARVLKPGGYVAAAVWSSPEKNPFIRIPMDVIKSITPCPRRIRRHRGSFAWPNPATWRACCSERDSLHWMMKNLRPRWPTSPERNSFAG